MKVHMLGAAGCVTGSKFLMNWRGYSLLVDCGLFQGPASNRRLNWRPLGFDASVIDAVVLTHAHIDHSGYLPRLVRQGFSGPVFCTPPTKALLGILLPDAAKLQEEEARYANKKRYSRWRPALPLFRVSDAKAALKLLVPVPFGEWVEVGPGIRFRFHRQGHILGAAAIELQAKDSTGKRRTFYFSGDVGRYGVPILREPEPYPGSDFLFVESTYGDRLHDPTSPYEALADSVGEALHRGGVVLIPAFAVDRTQEVIYILHQLMESGELERVSIYLDSPMAVATTHLYSRFLTEHDPEVREFFAENVNPILPPELVPVPDVAGSKRLNDLDGKCIIISASGMATGGRVLHHLKLRLPDSSSTVIFVGYQAAGTRGRELVDGASSVTIHGEEVPVRAKIVHLSCLSAHADSDELLLWLKRASKEPERVVLIHGEPDAQRALASRIDKELGWPTEIPTLGEALHF